MFRITATPMEGSDAPRVFFAQKPPDRMPDGDMLRFIGYPFPRLVRLKPEDVLSIEVGRIVPRTTNEDADTWEGKPFDPYAPREPVKPKRQRRKGAPPPKED